MKKTIYTLNAKRTKALSNNKVSIIEKSIGIDFTNRENTYLSAELEKYKQVTISVKNKNHRK